jgi:glycine oxidase
VSAVQSNQITISDHVHSFDFVFDCRGLGARNIFQDLRSIRGELIWLHAPDVHITRPIRVMHPRYSLYVVPRPDNTYIIGASEIESADQSQISVRTTLELLTAACSLQANFQEARIIKTVTHCRPTLTNHLPKIKYADGFVALNGLYRHGYLIAPALVADIMRWIEGGMASLHYPALWEKIA